MLRSRRERDAEEALVAEVLAVDEKGLCAKLHMC